MIKKSLKISFISETPVTMSMQMDRIGSRPTGTNHDNVCPSTTSGMDYLRNPRLFKGMGFALDERQALGIHGLLPPRVKSQAEQTDNCLRNSKYNCENYSIIHEIATVL